MRSRERLVGWSVCLDSVPMGDGRPHKAFDFCLFGAPHCARSARFPGFRADFQNAATGRLGCSAGPIPLEASQTIYTVTIVFIFASNRVSRRSGRMLGRRERNRPMGGRDCSDCSQYVGRTASRFESLFWGRREEKCRHALAFTPCSSVRNGIPFLPTPSDDALNSGTISWSFRRNSASGSQTRRSSCTKARRTSARE